MLARIVQILLALAGVAVVTYAGYLSGANPPTVGFGFLLAILIIASTTGFQAAAAASIAATLAFNFYFLPPVGTLTIADPQNWFALFSFLATSLIGSQLSAQAKRQAAEAISRQQDLEQLYTFSRSILLIDQGSFSRQLATRLAEVFEFEAVLLYDKRSDEILRAGPADFEGLEDQLKEAAQFGSSYTDPTGSRVIMTVRLGSEPIGSVALQGRRKPDAVLQGISNLIAIGLERARAQTLTHEIEAVRQSELLRTTLIDAMAHEFKTPLTAIKAATTALLAAAPSQSDTEILKVADEEADHLRDLIDDAVDMARLDMMTVDVQPLETGVGQLARDVAFEIRNGDGRVSVAATGDLSAMVDRRLIKLALKQLIDNALKYSPPGSPVSIRVGATGERVEIAVINEGKQIPESEQSKIFDRFYRGPASRINVPGTGLGLSIAQRIMTAHGGSLTVNSRAGQTAFSMLFRRAGEGTAE